MATGIQAPAPGSLDPNGSVNLENASLPDVDDPAWTLIGDILGDATLADPRPDAYELAGILGPIHDLSWLDKIHVIPREADLGFVVSEQIVEVEVWNAYMTRAKTLNQITQSGPAGVEIIDHLGQPAHYPASRSEIYEIKVLEEGAPTIDNYVVWEFIGIDSSGTDIRLIGFRIIPFPYRPNSILPITEEYGYLTDVLTSWRGMEQRIQLRVIPIGTLSYAALMVTPQEAQMAWAILFGNQPRAFGLGRWQFARPLTAQADPEDTEIFLDTTNIPFVAGGLVFVWSDPFSWEAHTIDSIQSDRLVLTQEIASTWEAGKTLAMPMVIGRLSTRERMTWESLYLTSSELVFDVDGFKV